MKEDTYFNDKLSETVCALAFLANFLEIDVRKLSNPEKNSPSLGDLIQAGHPVAHAHEYSDTHEVQGYRVGPLLVMKLSPRSRKGVILWLNLDPEIEAELSPEAASAHRLFCERYFDDDQHEDYGFEISQPHINQLCLEENPLIIARGDFSDLTRSTGRVLKQAEISAFQVDGDIVCLTKALARMAAASNSVLEKIFNDYNPTRRKVCDTKLSRTSGSPQTLQDKQRGTINSESSKATSGPSYQLIEDAIAEWE